jgi:hypothetical protein
MKRHRLRIVGAVGGVVGCLLLLALWMRSYYYRDVVGGVVWSHVLTIESVEGSISVDWYYLNPAFSGRTGGVTSYGRSSHGFGVRITPRFALAYWPLLLLFGTLCLIPWMGRIAWDAKFSRFSLRDLFIITTLAALILGLIAYALR